MTKDAQFSDVMATAEKLLNGKLGTPFVRNIGQAIRSCSYQEEEFSSSMPVHKMPPQHYRVVFSFAKKGSNVVPVEQQVQYNTRVSQPLNLL